MMRSLRIQFRMRVSLVLVFLFFVCKYGVSGDTISNILKSTRPAYTIAIESRILDDSSVCRKEMNLFREAIDNQKLWSLRSKSKVANFIFRFFVDTKAFPD